LSLRAARSEITHDLDKAHVGDAAHLLGAHVVSGRDLIERLQGDEPFVDDRTDLEFRPLPRRFGKRSQTYHAKNLAFLAGAHQDAVSWLEGTGPGVALALKAGGESLATLALEMQRRVDGGKVVPADALRDVLAADPDAVWARAITHRRLYPDLLAQGRFEEAIQLRYAPDRCLAYLALAKRTEGEQRRFYLLSALRENSLLGANPMTSPPEFVQQSVDLLNELARDLEGAEKLFCTNRVHILAGTDPEPGEESLPLVELPDLVEALERGDFAAARERLQAARASGQGREMDRKAWNWWQSAEDPREAFRGLFEIGADSVVRAARKLYGKGRTEDVVAVAGYFCSLHPLLLAPPGYAQSVARTLPPPGHGGARSRGRRGQGARDSSPRAASGADVR
jgi:hypothetical protein